MKRFITLLLVSLSTILLITCSNQSSNSLDGEYYWINESRNELTFTIDKDSPMIELTDSNITSQKESYTFKDAVFTCKYFRNKAKLLQKGVVQHIKSLEEIRWYVKLSNYPLFFIQYKCFDWSVFYCLINKREIFHSLSFSAF